MWSTVIGAALVVVLLDRWSKALVRSRPTERWTIAVAPGVSIRHVRAAMRLHSPLIAAAGLLLTVTLLGALLATGRVFREPASWIGIGSAVAGAASNVYDRMHDRFIVDFVCVGWWPAFNVADVAIVVGAATALLSLR